MKFGGTSVGPTESNDGVARIVATAVEKQAGGTDAGGGIAEAALAAVQLGRTFEYFPALDYLLF